MGIDGRMPFTLVLWVEKSGRLSLGLFRKYQWNESLGAAVNAILYPHTGSFSFPLTLSVHSLLFPSSHNKGLSEVSEARGSTTYSHNFQKNHCGWRAGASGHNKKSAVEAGKRHIRKGLSSILSGWNFVLKTVGKPWNFSHGAAWWYSYLSTFVLIRCYI